MDNQEQGECRGEGFQEDIHNENLRCANEEISMGCAHTGKITSFEYSH